MSDPTVTAYLTKLLCSYGGRGRLERNQLADILDLPAEQIEQILQNEPLRFPQSYQLVLARSPLRICAQYLHPKGEEEKEKCRKLHLCRHYLRGLCPPNRRPPCRFSHDVFSDHNRAVLKAHELSGLNEEEIKVLLFQNDHQLLPENCWKYMHNNCDQGEDCTRLHVCIYFIRGECNNYVCKQSHNLLESKVLLTCSWLSPETIQNFQMLCVLTHNKRQQALREEPRNEEFRGVRGKSQGRGRPRDRRRASSHYLMKDRSKERWNKGPHVCRQPGSHQPSQCSRGQHLEDDSYKSDGENDYDDGISETRLDSLMEEWFSQNTASRYAHAFPSAPSNIPNTDSVAPILSHKSDQPQTHAPCQTTEQTKTDVYRQVGYSNSLNTPMISSRKEASLHQPAVLTALNKPTLKSGQSITSPKPFITSSTLINSSSGCPSTHLKPLTGSARLPSPPTVSSTSALTSNKLRNASIDASYIFEPGIVPSIISAKPSLVSSNFENSSCPSTPNQTVKKLDVKVCSLEAEPANAKPIPLGSTSKSASIAKPKPAVSAVAGQLESSSSLSSISDFSSIPIRVYTRRPIKIPDAASVIQQPQYDLIHLKPKPTNSKESKSQQTTNILCATPQKCDKTLDELATWTNNGQPNTKKVSSSIPSSGLKTVYVSKPTETILFTAENQKDILSRQKIKQMNDHYRTESEVHWRSEFLDIAKLKMTSGSIKSDANHSNQKKADSTLKVVNYPPTWDIKAVPAVGYQNIPLPQTCDEFINVIKMFNKTVQDHKVQKVWRVQNPTLWWAYQRQKDQMKKKNSGIDVQERQLFHGTDSVNITTICRDNFDWCVCGNNSILYGQGNYFARDASYVHYSPANPAGTKTMFVARVLVGDVVKGEPTMRHPPQKHRSAESYNCCVNSVINPSIFVVFEKSQAYPEYVLEYKREKKSACNIS